MGFTRLVLCLLLAHVHVSTGTLTRTLSSTDIVNGIQFSVTVEGDTFSGSDSIIIRKDDCDGAEITPGSPDTTGSDSTKRVATMTPSETYATAIVCLTKDGTPQVVGSDFEIHAPLGYTLPEGDVAKNVRFDAVLAGISSFNVMDEISFYKTSCSGTLLQGSSTLQFNTGNSRMARMTPSETGTVVVCLSRNGGPQAQIGSSFSISEIVYTPTPGEAATKIEQQLVLSGISDFAGTDTVTLRESACSGSEIPNSATATTGTGTSRTLTVTLTSGTSAAVVCLTRAGLPIAQIGSDFPVKTLVADLTPSVAVADIQFTMAITGITDFSNTDIITFRHEDLGDECGGALVSGSAIAHTNIPTTSSSRTLTFTPSEQVDAAAACLSRNGGPPGLVGFHFAIAAPLTYTLDHTPSRGIEFTATALGAPDLGSDDDLTIRDSSCDGAEVAVASTLALENVTLAGNVKGRSIIMIPDQHISEAVLCISRSGGPRVKLGESFIIHPHLNFSLDYSPAVGLEFQTLIQGLPDFADTDMVTFRKDSCSGSPLATSAISVSGTGDQRTATTTPSEAYASVVACVSRHGGPDYEIPQTFAVSTILQDISNPSEPAVGLEFAVTLSGVSDWDLAEDVVTIKETTCGGSVVDSSIVLGILSDTLVATIVPNTAASDAVVCLQRGSAEAKIGDPFVIATISYTSTPLETAVDIQTSIALAGVTDFSNSDSITLMKTSCTGTTLATSSATVSGDGSSRTVQFVPSEAFNPVFVCLARHGRPSASVGNSFQVKPALAYSLNPSEAAIGLPLRVTVTGVTDFDLGTSEVSIRDDCGVSGVDLLDDGSTTVASSFQVTLDGTPKSAVTAVVCFSRNGATMFQVGSSFTVLPRLTYALDQHPLKDVGIAVTLSGLSGFDSNDEITFHNDSCSGSAVMGTTPTSTGSGTTRSASMIPSQALASVVVCLSRDSMEAREIMADSGGYSFAIDVLTYDISNPSQPAQGVQCDVMLQGASDFTNADTIVLRKDSCVGAEITSTLKSTFGTGTSRTLALTPQEAYSTTVACFSRTTPDGEVTAKVGASFAISTITLTATPSELVDTIPQRLSLGGVTDFHETDDSVTLKKVDCSGADYTTVGSIVHSAPSSSERVMEFTPGEVATVFVCLSRNSRPPLEVGSLTVHAALTYTITPASPATGMELIIQCQGINSFDAMDTIRLRDTTCSGADLGPEVTMSGTGSTREGRITPSTTSGTAVVCISRGGLGTYVSVGASVVISQITYTLDPSNPVENVQFSVEFSGVSDFNDTTDTIAFRKSSCLGVMVSGSSVVVSGSGASLTATMTPSEPANNVAVCLTRSGVATAAIDPLFEIAGLQYTLDPSEPVHGIQNTLTLTGIPDFTGTDDITIREDDCTGDTVAPASVSLSGTGTSRTATVTINTAYATCAVCLKRGAEPIAQVGATFTVASPLAYTLDNTHPALGVEFMATLSGISSFDANDVITLRKTDCVGSALSLSPQATTGLGSGRSLTAISTETFANVAICLERNGGPVYQVGNTFSLDEITYSLSPTDPSALQQQTLTLAGVTDFSTSDTITIRITDCAGALLSTETDLTLTGTGTTRTATFIASGPQSDLVPCLERGGHPIAVVGTDVGSFEVQAPIAYAASHDPALDVKFDVTLSGVTDFDGSDMIQLHKANCSGPNLSLDGPTHTLTGTQRRLTGTPREASAEVAVCLSRNGGPYLQVGDAFPIRTITYTIPKKPANGQAFQVTCEGVTDFGPTDTITIHATDCSGPQATTMGTPHYSETGTIRSVTLTINETIPNAAVCLTRSTRPPALIASADAGTLFAVPVPLAYSFDFPEVCQDVPFQVVVKGLDDFDPLDNVTIRENDCLGTPMGTVATDLDSWTPASNRTITFTATSPGLGVVCLTRIHNQVSQVGDSFTILAPLTYQVSPSNPSINIEMEITCEGLTTFGANDVMEIRQTSCLGSPVPNAAGIVLTGTGPNRTATLTPTDDTTDVVLCLSRNGGDWVAIGDVFNISTITYFLDPLEPAQEIPQTIILEGVRDFDGAEDVVEVRLSSCGGSILGTTNPGTPSGSMRLEVPFLPNAAAGSAVVCLTRGHHPTVALSGSFVILPPLTYALNHTYPALYVKFHVAVEGPSDFANDDLLALRLIDCAGEALDGGASFVDGGGSMRQLTLIPQEPREQVVVCLSRNGGAYVQIGVPFTIYNITYTLTPTMPAVGIPQTLTITGIQGLDVTQDTLTLHNADCTNPSIAAMAGTISGGDTSLTTTFTPSLVSSTIALCLTRRDHPAAYVGPLMTISPTLDHTLTPTEPTQDIQFQVTVHGVEDFGAHDTITLHDTSCDGSSIGSVVLSGSGPNRTATITPSTSFSDVVACLNRHGLGKSQIASSFAILGPLSIAQNRDANVDVEFELELSGITQFNERDLITIHKDMCSGQAIPGTITLQDIGSTRKALIIPTQAYSTAVACLSREEGPRAQVGSSFAITALTYTLAPIEPTQGVYFKVEIQGASDFGVSDDVVVQAGDCTDTSLSSNREQESVQGTGLTRSYGLVLTTSTTECVVCLRRDPGLPYTQIGSNFTVKPELIYATTPSTPTAWAPLSITLSGITTFDANDAITLRDTDCSGALIDGSSVTLSDTGSSRVASLTCGGVVQNVQACLSRDGGPLAPIGATFSIEGAHDFDYSPKPIARGQTTTITVEGLGLSTTDKYYLHADDDGPGDCSGLTQWDDVTVGMVSSPSELQIPVTMNAGSYTLCYKFQSQPFQPINTLTANFTVLGPMTYTTKPSPPPIGVDFELDVYGHGLSTSDQWALVNSDLDCSTASGTAIQAQDVESTVHLKIEGVQTSAGKFSVCYNFQGLGWEQIAENLTVTGATNYDVTVTPVHLTDFQIKIYGNGFTTDDRWCIIEGSGCASLAGETCNFVGGTSLVSSLQIDLPIMNLTSGRYSVCFHFDEGVAWAKLEPDLLVEGALSHATDHPIPTHYEPFNLTIEGFGLSLADTYGLSSNASCDHLALVPVSGVRTEGDVEYADIPGIMINHGVYYVCYKYQTIDWVVLPFNLTVKGIEAISPTSYIGNFDGLRINFTGTDLQAGDRTYFTTNTNCDGTGVLLHEYSFDQGSALFSGSDKIPTGSRHLCYKFATRDEYFWNVGVTLEVVGINNLDTTVTANYHEYVDIPCQGVGLTTNDEFFFVRHDFPGDCEDYLANPSQQATYEGTQPRNLGRNSDGSYYLPSIMNGTLPHGFYSLCHKADGYMFMHQPEVTLELRGLPVIANSNVSCVEPYIAGTPVTCRMTLLDEFDRPTGSEADACHLAVCPLKDGLGHDVVISTLPEFISTGQYFFTFTATQAGPSGLVGVSWYGDLIGGANVSLTFLPAPPDSSHFVTTCSHDSGSTMCMTSKRDAYDNEIQQCSHDYGSGLTVCDGA